MGSCHFPETLNSDVEDEGWGWGDLKKREGFLLPNFPISLSKYPKRNFSGDGNAFFFDSLTRHVSSSN